MKPKQILNKVIAEKFGDARPEYERALKWKAEFAKRGFKLMNKFIPDTFVKPGER